MMPGFQISQVGGISPVVTKIGNSQGEVGFGGECKCIFKLGV